MTISLLTNRGSKVRAPGRSLRAAIVVALLGVAAAGSPIAAAAPVRDGCTGPQITSISPSFGSGDTPVTISGCDLGGITQLLFGDTSAAFKVLSSSSLQSTAPLGGVQGSTVSVSGYATQTECGPVLKAVVRRDNTGKPPTITYCQLVTSPVASAASFSYPAGEMDVTGPYPRYKSEDQGDHWWANGGAPVVEFQPGQAHGYLGNLLVFNSAAPVFHITVSYVDDQNEFSELETGTDHYWGAYVTEGNEASYSAHLQTCSVQASPGSGYGSCVNWDGNSGEWVDVPNTEADATLGSSGVGETTFGDLAVQAPAFDVSDPSATLAATYRIAWSLGEGDTNGGLPQLYRSGHGYSDRFNVVVIPSAMVQMKVMPYTLMYQPPGNQSTSTMATSYGYGTDLKMGDSTTQSNSYSVTTTKSWQLSAAAAFVAGLSFNDGGSYDNSTTQQFGTTDDASTETSDAEAFKYTFSAPADVGLVPGDGTTCTSDMDCTKETTPSAIQQYNNEPFWDDTFVLLVHPQYAVYVLGSGQSRWVLNASVPVVANISVRELYACLEGEHPAGLDPCNVGYTDDQVQGVDGGVVYKGVSTSVELSAQDAENLLNQDPFYVGGQSANVDTTRGIPIESGTYGSNVLACKQPCTSGDPVEAPFADITDNTKKETTGAGAVQTTTNSSQTVVGSTVGGGESAGGGTDGAKLSIGVTLGEGEKDVGTTSFQTKYDDSTANSTLQETTDTFSIQDYDNTTPGNNGQACKVCHGPMPNASKVNVYLDRMFGSFMFQDPNAPSAPPRTSANLTRLQKLIAVDINAQEQSKANGERIFSDVARSSPAHLAVNTLDVEGIMTGLSSGKFGPGEKLTRLTLATALGHAVALPAVQTLGLLKGWAKSPRVAVTEAAMVKALSKMMKISPSTAKGYLTNSLRKFDASKTVDRADGARVLFKALETKCVESCDYTDLVPVVQAPNIFSLGASTPELEMQPGHSSSTLVSSTPISGAKTQQLRFSVSGLPAGVAAQFAPASVAAGKSTTLTVSAPAGTPAGTFPVLVRATEGPQSFTTTVDVTVTTPKAPTALTGFRCAAQSAEISCGGLLKEGSSGLAGDQVEISYQPPSGSASADTMQTNADGGFQDNFATATGGPLPAGDWKVTARYFGDASTLATSVSQTVNVP